MNLGRTFRELYSKDRRDARPVRIGLGEDALYALLSDSRRRFVIERLADRDSESCAALAGEIAAAETHMPKEQVPRRRVEPVKEDLRDEQLPRLADAGVVVWEDGTDEIRPGHSVDAIVDLLEEVERRIARESRSGAVPLAAGGSSTDWRSECTRSGGHHS